MNFFSVITSINNPNKFTESISDRAIFNNLIVVADKKTNVEQVITSLIGQAEHDPNSQSLP